MKKILVHLSIFSMGVSGVVNLTQTIENNHFLKNNYNDSYIESQIHIEEDSNVEWDDLYKNVDVYLNVIKKIQTFNLQNKDDELLEKGFELARENSLKMIDIFKAENLNLTEIEARIKLENPEFAKSMEEETINVKKEFDLYWENHQESQFSKQKLTVFASRTTYQDQEDRKRLTKLVKDLKISKAVFASLSAAASIAAAGFYAAAFWTFGATLPWATGCTIAASVLGVVSAGISFAQLTYDKEMNKWSKAGSAIGGALTLGLSIASILYKVLVPSIFTLTGISWVFPPITAAIATIGAIIAIIDLF